MREVGEQRPAHMDDQGIDVAVLSLSSPGVQDLPEAGAIVVTREANTQLAEIVAPPAPNARRSEAPHSGRPECHHAAQAPLRRPRQDRRGRPSCRSGTGGRGDPRGELPAHAP
ncbi:hypothetical protein GCM10010176_074640 [Nonomuraea spiralis]|nr:hypothetical protein GCM10010176_074640 [Nonomuraea spiralis]